MWIDKESFSFSEFGQFDVIIMWHVFEHIENPLIFMKNIAKLLFKDGIIILDIPNRNSLGFNLTKKRWFHLDVPRHLFHYNYQIMCELLKKCELRIFGFRANNRDYLQDLSASFYMLFASKEPFIYKMIALVSIPVAFMVRLITALVAPRLAELNTYVIKKEYMLGKF